MIKNSINCLFTKNSENGITKTDIVGFLNLLHQFVPADTTIFNNIKDLYSDSEEISELYEYINDYIKEVSDKYNKTSDILLELICNSKSRCGFEIVPKEFPSKSGTSVEASFLYKANKLEIRISVNEINHEINDAQIDLFIPRSKYRSISIDSNNQSSYNNQLIGTLIKGNISFNEIYKYMLTLNDFKLSGFLTSIIRG